jgi:hypothetical protein
MQSAISKPNWAALQRTYVIGTSVASLAALVVTGLITALLGGGAKALALGEVALLIGVVISFAPAIIGRNSETFGITVLAASIARMLTVLGIVIIAANVLDIPRRPVGLGVGAGLLLALIAEVMLALSVLSRADSSERLTA